MVANCKEYRPKSQLKSYLNLDFTSSYLWPWSISLPFLSSSISISVRWNIVAICAACPEHHLLFWGKLFQTICFLWRLSIKKAPSNKDCTIQPGSFTKMHQNATGKEEPLPLFVKQCIIRLSNIPHLYPIPFCRKGGHLFNTYQHQLCICHCLYQQNLLSWYKFHSCSRMKATYNQNQRRGGKSVLISCRPQVPIFYVGC